MSTTIKSIYSLSFSILISFIILTLDKQDFIIILKKNKRISKNLK